MSSGDASNAESRDTRVSETPAIRRLVPYVLIVLGGALPLLALAVFAYVMSARALERLARTGNDATATITAGLIEREAENWINAVTSETSIPALIGAVIAGDAGEVRRNLEAFVESYPRLDRAFVTDPTGLLWSDYPMAPESIGLSFDDRDWYRGVAAAGAPYISEVYRRNAMPRRLVVAVAAPVLDPATRATAGYLVAQVRLDDLSTLLGSIEVGADGIAMLIDHTGTAVAHPLLDVEAELNRAYTSVGDSFEGVSGQGVARGEYEDPVTSDRVLASAVTANVAENRWTVIAQQPVAAAFAASRNLAWQLGIAGLLLAALMSALVYGLAREDGRRRRAELALADANQALERRVEERTNQLRQKEQELLQSQKMEAIGRLAGGVAHDFNNLLTIVLGSTELLMDRYPAGTPEREDLREIFDAANRAAKLTAQLLAFGRKQVMQPEVINLNEVLEGMREMLDRVRGEDVDLVWKLAPGLHRVKFDPGQIEQVVMNLVINARDAMPRGGKLTIDTANVELDEEYVAEHSDAQLGPHVMLAISDTGVGMQPDVRRKIFEPFFTTKHLGQGTGLGLSTCYGIVKQGGGNIWVYSEPGRGTTFKVYLPRSAETGSRPPAASPAPVDSNLSGTVLVVEDDDRVRALIVRVLSNAGLDVLEAADVASARRLHAGQTDPVDLLLTDVVLPDGSGPELAVELERAQPGLGVLFMSGYTDDAIVHHGMLKEGVAFIEKPLRPTALLDKLRKALAAR